MIRIKDIAHAASVSTATVSLALQNHPRISEATKRKIRQVADELGYQSDPMLQALNRHRWNQQTRAGYCNLAFVTRLSHEALLHAPSHRAAWEGCQQRAKELGYAIQPFTINNHPRDQKRQVTKLLRQGIRGILMGGTPGAQPRFHLDWSKFAAVTVGLNLHVPRFHSVRFDHRHDIETACRQLRRRGYQRVGFCVLHTLDVRDGHAWRSAFLLQKDLGRFRKASLHIMQRVNDDFVRWIRREKLDAVIFWDSYLLPKLVEAGIEIPEDLGFVTLRADDKTQSGIVKDGSLLGARAVDLLHLQIVHGKWGVPAMATTTLVSAKWQAGNTLRRLKDAGNSGQRDVG